MPIFEFECRGCGQQFEFLQRTADTKAACPSCGMDDVQRLMSLCAVSSDASRAANLSAAHRRAAAKRTDKQRSEHAHQHDHFGDASKSGASGPKESK